MYPQFVCVGAAKSGTTSLQDLLSGHPEVFLSEKKEIHFFDDDDNYSKGESWYAAYFPKALTEGKLVGEVTPDYMFYDYVAERIHKTLGADTKLIFMMRNPVDRAFSEFQHNYRRGFIDETNFRTSLSTDIKLLKENQPRELSDRHVSYIYRGLYSRHIQYYQKYFPKENMFFIRFEEDFIQNRDKCLEELCQFLGIEPMTFDTEGGAKNKAYQPKARWINKLVYRKNPVKALFRILIPSFALRQSIRDSLSKFNASKDKVAKVSQENRLWLYENFFAEDIIKTEQLIGKDLSSWKLKNRPSGAK